jgi:hypothetical protein
LTNLSAYQFVINNKPAEIYSYLLLCTIAMARMCGFPALQAEACFTQLCQLQHLGGPSASSCPGDTAAELTTATQVRAEIMPLRQPSAASLFGRIAIPSAARDRARAGQASPC